MATYHPPRTREIGIPIHTARRKCLDQFSQEHIACVQSAQAGYESRTRIHHSYRTLDSLRPTPRKLQHRVLRNPMNLAGSHKYISFQAVSFIKIEYCGGRMLTQHHYKFQVSSLCRAHTLLSRRCPREIKWHLAAGAHLHRAFWPASHHRLPNN